MSIFEFQFLNLKGHEGVHGERGNPGAPGLPVSKSTNNYIFKPVLFNILICYYSFVHILNKLLL